MADVRLTQRARAGMQFLGMLRAIASSDLRDQAREEFFANERAAPLVEATRREPDAPVSTWMKRVRQASFVAGESEAYRHERFYQGVGGREIFVRGICAIEECRDQLAKAAPPDTGSRLDLDPTVVPPGFWHTEWHTMPGGWDGYDLYGPMFQHVITPHVFRYGGYAVVETGQSRSLSREKSLALLPRRRYERIYEVGCGSGANLLAARRLFPDAELIGSDVSAVQLRQGHATSERLGAGVVFKQRLADQTREPDASIDLVISYAFFHELPRHSTLAVLREMKRVLRPGGVCLITDAPPFRAVDLFQAVIMDWETRNHDEPYFSISCASNWAKELRDLGFVDVAEHG
ncbi:MAG: class I SAM-dependent methyltransferase, partial [Alphaproteobacteria bacterium]|nr:class I SAM-dependent methyltransferase [Alphaproteobacteria bacterium]